ncbi:hypothetical protein ACSVH2_07215 [Flavobacterium sp. RSB2_4_14]|uniref:hypothetical protein n=1 Tax=Flavobacterium sp. RSB2_4_14 TaxID=3447665 RepID=UPI003F3BE3F8
MKTKIYYDELKHITQKNEVFKYAEIYRKAKEHLEQITKQPINDAFYNDMQSYSIEAIKQAYPKPFELGLELDVTLNMIKIDIKPIIEAQAKLLLCKLPTKLVNGAIELDKTEADFYVYLNPAKADEYNNIKTIIDTFKIVDRHQNGLHLLRALGTDRVNIQGYDVNINPSYFAN